MLPVAGGHQVAHRRQHHRRHRESRAPDGARVGGHLGELWREDQRHARHAHQAPHDKPPCQRRPPQQPYGHSQDQRLRAVTHGHQARGDVLFGVVHADVRHRIHEHPLQRQQGVLLGAEPQALPAQPRPGQHQQSGQREAHRHAELRCGLGQLVHDGVPGRAPDEHADGEELPGAQGAVWWPGRHLSEEVAGGSGPGSART